MKRLFLSFITLLIFSGCSFAGDIPGLKYKNIKPNTKISYSEGIWETGRKSGTYFVKKEGLGHYPSYLNSEGNYAFSTDCEYEFLSGGRFFGYSNEDLIFYEIKSEDGAITKVPLSKEETAALLPEYRIVTFNEFSPYTNSLKIKKGHGTLKLLFYNETGNDFSGYTFSSGNAKFETYPVRGILNVKKAGMIQFSKDGEKSAQSPWYIILVR